MKSLASKQISFILPVALLLSLMLVACNSAQNAGSNPTKYPFLVGVTLQPHAVPSIAVAGTVQMNANAEYQVSATETTNKDVTSSVAWSTSDASVATVDRGLVTGIGIGSVRISAISGSKSAVTKVYVGLSHEIVITPTGPFSLSANPNISFRATETFPDGSTLDVSSFAFWTASPGGIVNMYPFLGGDATLVGTGTATITATLDAEEAVTATITVAP